jgi:Cytochrome P450
LNSHTPFLWLLFVWVQVPLMKYSGIQIEASFFIVFTVFPICKEIFIKPTAASFDILCLNFLDNYTIPSGTIIVLDILDLHRDPKYWENDADQFIPERFEPERFAKVHPNAYVPFTSKIKSCSS